MKIFLHPAAIPRCAEIEEETGLAAYVDPQDRVELRPRSIFRAPASPDVGPPAPPLFPAGFPAFIPHVPPVNCRCAPPSRIDAIIEMDPKDLDKPLK